MGHRRNSPVWMAIWIAAAALHMNLAAALVSAQSADPLPYRPLEAYPHKAPGSKSGPVVPVPLGRMSDRPPCRCQNYGTYLFVGDIACIRTNKGPRMARCILKGNNTMWEFLSDMCPVS